MNGRRRIELLEKQIPSHAERPFPDFDFQVAGLPRSYAQKEMIRRLQLSIDDPRATPQQQAAWKSAIASIEPALKWQLESEQRRACPECEYPLHDLVDGRLYKCRRCGCPVIHHSDGHVTDARPDQQNKT